MLAKLLNNGGDYTRSLKRRRAVGIALLLVGLVGFVCYFFLVPGSSLPDFAQGFYLGAASGISLGSVILILRSQYLLTHPTAQRKARIRDTDEREKQILNDAFRWAGIVAFFTAAGALFVVLPFSREAFFALMGMMALYAVTFVIACRVLERRV